MTTRTLPRALSARAAALASASLAALGLLAAPLFTASAAHAHDELIDQQLVFDEADGSVEAITLTFNNSILDVGTEIVVTGPEGDATDGAPVTKGPDVTQPIADELPLGDYRVAWRVVSSDGHPIDGTFEFTVLEDAVEYPDSRSQENADEAASDAGSEESAGDGAVDDTEASDDAPDSGDGLSLGALVGIAVAATLFAVGATVVAIVSMRRKRAALEAGAGPDGAGGDAAGTHSASTDSTDTDSTDTEEDAK